MEKALPPLCECNCVCVFEGFFFLQWKRKEKKNVDFVKRKIIIYVNDENQNSSNDNNNADEKKRKKKKIRERKDCVWESSTKLSLQLFMFCCCYRCSLVYIVCILIYVGELFKKKIRRNFLFFPYHVHRNFIQMENDMRRTSLQVSKVDLKKNSMKVECILVWHN